MLNGIILTILSGDLMQSRMKIPVRHEAAEPRYFVAFRCCYGRFGRQAICQSNDREDAIVLGFRATMQDRRPTAGGALMLELGCHPVLMPGKRRCCAVEEECPNRTV